MSNLSLKSSKFHQNILNNHLNLTNIKQKMHVALQFSVLDGKESACNAGDPGQSLGQEDLLQKGRGAWWIIVNGVAKSLSY